MKTEYNSHGTGTAPDVSPAFLALRRSLQDDDRHRLDLAHHLHKEIVGNLVACTAMGEMIRHDLARGADLPTIDGAFANLDSTLRQTMQWVGQLTGEQFPPMLKALGLNEALQQLVKELGRDLNGSLVLNIEQPGAVLDLPQRLNLFRILQALITRCIGQAHASQVAITCYAAGPKAVFTIDHNGDASLWEAPTGAAELAMIEARCAVPGLRIHITQTSVGHGTRITVAADLPEAPSAT